LAPVKLID
jgi:pentatricopeptide repeat protein